MAARFFVTGGSGLTNTIASWSLTSGGAGGQTIPTAADDITFDVNSPAATVNLALAGLSLTFTGFTNTITMTNGITVSGSVTLASGMTIAGSGALALAGATGTLTSAGKTWPNALNYLVAGTYTLADNWTIGGLFTSGANAISNVFNGFQINCNAGFTRAGTSGTTNGTTLIVLSGTGTLSFLGAQIGSNLTINTAGTITQSGTWIQNGGTITYTAGTVVTTGTTLNMNAATTLATNGIIWNNVTFTGGGITHTLTNDLRVTGTLSTTNTSTALTINGANINLSGPLTMTYSTGSISGTTVFRIIGTCTITTASVTSGRFNNQLVFNAPGSTITLASTTFAINLNTFSYLAGTISSAGATPTSWPVVTYAGPMIMSGGI